MAEEHVRKTQARYEERARRRAERERRERIIHLIPFGLIGVIALLLIGFGFYSSIKTTGVFVDPNGKAQFTVDTEKLELGDQKLGRPIKASFNVKNTGDGKLTLSTPPMVTALEGC